MDIGCGNGRLRQWLNDEVIREGNYYGLDLSKELLDIARKTHPKDHFFCGNMAERFPFGDDNFDSITGIASFHHLLNKKDQMQCLSECKRVLKPNGVLFLTTWKLPEKFRWSNFLLGRFKNWNVPFGPEKHPRTYRNVTPAEMKSLLKKAGFKVLHCKYFEDRNLVVIAQK